MPYLNWKLAEIRQDIKAHPRLGSQIELELGGSEKKALELELQDLFTQGGNELRVDLPKNWTLFWKLREFESRLLLAHPQPEQWVATLALAPEHGASVLESLKSGVSRIEISTLGGVGKVSNLELVLCLASPP